MLDRFQVVGGKAYVMKLEDMPDKVEMLFRNMEKIAEKPN